MGIDSIPARLFAQGEAAQFVERFCDGLDESQRDVFVLCVLEKRTAPQAAALLSVNVNTVYSRMRNTRAQFRAELQRLKRDYEAMAESTSQLMAEIYDTAMDFRDSIPLYDTDTLEL